VRVESKNTVDHKTRGIETYKQQLAARLRSIRTERGVSCLALGRKAGMSEAKVSRIETGISSPRLEDLTAILKSLNCDSEEAEEILSLARAISTFRETDNLFAVLQNKLVHPQEQSRQLEQACTTFRNFGLVLHGLLQTAEYARTVLSKSVTNDVASLVQARLERQLVLYDSRKSFTFLLSEFALCTQRLEPTAMRAQYHHLISLASLENVHIGVLPLTAKLDVSPSSNFGIFDNELVYVDTQIGTFFSSNTTEVDDCKALLDSLSTVALWDEDARNKIRSFLYQPDVEPVIDLRCI